jgi:pimeloyl-[acyl-carrier protein] methyl ester esterase
LPTSISGAKAGEPPQPHLLLVRIQAGLASHDDCVQKSYMHVCLLPGMDGSDSLATDFRAALPASISTSAVTYPRDRCLGYDALELQVREHLAGLRAPYVLLAESFSGPLAIRIAAAPPDGLRAIVLVATFHSTPLSPWLRFVTGPALFRWPMPLWAVRRYMLGPSASVSLCTRFAAAAALVRPEVLAARAREA